MIDPLISMWTFVDVQGVDVIQADWDEAHANLKSVVISTGTWSAAGGVVCYNPPLIAVARREPWPPGPFVTGATGGFGNQTPWYRDSRDSRVIFQTIGVVGLAYVLEWARAALLAHSHTKLSGMDNAGVTWREACIGRGIDPIVLPMGDP